MGVGATSVCTSDAPGEGDPLRSQTLRQRAGAGLTREPMRSLVLAGVGVAVLLEPSVALGVVAVAAGLLALAVGVAGLLRWVTRPRRRAGDLIPRRRLWPAAVALGALAAALVVIGSGSADEAPAATPLTCNGSTLLCDRPLNDVVFPATHNSFASVTIPTFLFGQQDGTIEDQLRFGIRGYLIDTYYGFATGGRVRTDTVSMPKRDAAVQELGEPAVKAAESIRSRLGVVVSWLAPLSAGCGCCG